MECKGEHELFCCGARVRICNSKVTVLSEPRLVYCPLHEALYGTKTIDKATVKKSVEAKISGFGLCCESRIFDDNLVVPYGASEILSVCLEYGLLDCAIVVCDGAGTVITENSKLVQAIGARLTGIIKTSPLKQVIKFIEKSNGVVLDSTTARIDQLEGVKHAAEKLGCKRIGVTVASFQSVAVEKIRNFERSHEKDGVKVAIFSVCNTCASQADVKRILRADVVCASASKLVREQIGPKALMQLGVGIPVFVLTDFGKSLALKYMEHFSDRLVVFRRKTLPYLVEEREPKLKEG